MGQICGTPTHASRRITYGFLISFCIIMFCLFLFLYTHCTKSLIPESVVSRNNGQDNVPPFAFQKTIFLHENE